MVKGLRFLGLGSRSFLYLLYNKPLALKPKTLSPEGFRV